jgi:hypothetical protein
MSRYVSDEAFRASSTWAGLIRRAGLIYGPLHIDPRVIGDGFASTRSAL